MEKKMENEMETGIIWGLHRDYRVYIVVILGIMEKKMETTIMGLGFRHCSLGFRAWGLGCRGRSGSLGFR